MSKHTPEPWKDGFLRVTALDGGMKIAVTSCEIGNVEIEQANANRIVTCVNACAGMADPAAEIAELKRQRDELLVALNKYEEAFDGLFGRCGSNGVFNHWGGRIDCSTLNEAHELSSNATKGPTS